MLAQSTPPTPFTHYCPRYNCKLISPDRCQQRRAMKCKMKNPYMVEYSSFFKECRECKGPEVIGKQDSRK